MLDVQATIVSVIIVDVEVYTTELTLRKSG